MTSEKMKCTWRKQSSKLSIKMPLRWNLVILIIVIDLNIGVYASTVCGDSWIDCGNGKCVAEIWKCDGDNDCGNYKDEENCGTVCGDSWIDCGNGKCVGEIWKCDGDNDCGNYKDEENCVNINNCPGFQCKNNQCIPEKWKCNGVVDCRDGSDEGDLCPKRCSSGYKLMEDNVTCEDIDECSVPGHCSQICINTNGSFICKCAEGYVLGDDNRKCNAVGKPATLLYLLAGEIRGIELNSSISKTIYSDSSAYFRSFDFDVADSKIFWTDWRSDTLNSYTQNTSEKIELLNAPDRPEYLKWDWLTRNLFFTNKYGSIVACDETGKYCATTVLNAASDISSFDISPKNGIMFWSVWDRHLLSDYGLIERADLDGSSRTEIVKEKIFWPSCVTVDEVMGRIYWVDIKLSIVEFSDFQGRQRKVLNLEELYFPSSMTIFEDNLFWFDFHTKTINSCNKFSGLNCTSVPLGNVGAQAILVFHKAKQTEGENHCMNNKCHHLCLPNQSGSSCRCSDGYENNNSTCSLISPKKSDVPQTAVITDADASGIDGSTNAEEKIIPTLIPEKDTNVKRIWTKYLIPVVGTIMLQYDEETI